MISYNRSKWKFWFATVFLYALKMASCMFFNPQQDQYWLSRASGIVGLDNCSAVYFTRRSYYFNYYAPFRWVIANISNDMHMTPIYPLKGPVGFKVLEYWSNRVDQIIYSIYFTNPSENFLQVLDLRSNSSAFNITILPQYDFVTYLNKNEIFIIDYIYPYQIAKGQAKQNNFTFIYDYPPILLTPTRLLSCSYKSKCMWLMSNGMMVNYPMGTQPIAHSIKNQMSYHLKFGYVNDTHLLYTSDSKGVVYQWQQIAPERYRPRRVLLTSNGSNVANMLLIRNESLLVFYRNRSKSFVYLPTNLLTDCSAHLAFAYSWPQNFTVACQGVKKQRPIIMGFEYRAMNGYMYAYLPIVDEITRDYCVSFRDINCKQLQQMVEVSPGLFATHYSYDCSLSSDMLLNGQFYEEAYYIQQCEKYSMEFAPVCLQCKPGYTLEVTSIIVLYSTRNSTYCRPLTPQQLSNLSANTSALNSTNDTGSSNITTNGSSTDNTSNTTNSTSAIDNQTNLNTSTTSNSSVDSNSSGNTTSNQTNNTNTNSSNTTAESPTNTTSNITIDNNTTTTNITNNTFDSNITTNITNNSSNNTIPNNDNTTNITINNDTTPNFTNANATATNATINNGTSNNGTTNTSNASNHIATGQEQQNNYKDLPGQAKWIVQKINSSVIHSKTPMAYAKNILQLTLFVYLIHAFLSFWILASLYYFLPFAPAFVDYVLLILWKTYNMSLFALFDIPQPQLPRLNHEPSTMDYGQIIISNDFLQFTFDPFVMFTVALINFFISILLKKLIKYLFETRQKLKLPWLKIDIFQSISDIIIQLLPVLFLPCTNFLFNPHYSNHLQKINLILFSTMGGVGVIFPFFYFSKLIKNKKKQKQVREKKSNKKTQRIDKKIENKKLLLPTEQKSMKFLKDQKSEQQKTNRIKNKQNQQKIKQKRKRYIERVKIFLITRSKQIDDFLICILHLTVPISVTLTNNLPFFISNGILIVWTVINSLFLQKNRLGIFLRRLYLMLYHCAFILMYVYQKEIVYYWAGIAALIIIAIYFLHELLALLYKIIKFLAQLFIDCRKRNRIGNLSNKKLPRDKEKPEKQILYNKKSQDMRKQISKYQQKYMKKYLSKKQIKQAMSIDFKQFMNKKQLEKKQQNKILNEDSVAKGQKSSKEVQNKYYFSNQLQIAQKKLIPFQQKLIIDKSRQKRTRKSERVKKQKLRQKIDSIKLNCDESIHHKYLSKDLQDFKYRDSQGQISDIISRK